MRSGDVVEPLQLATGDAIAYTITEGAYGTGSRVSVNYDGFVDDVAVGALVLVDGGIMGMDVVSIDGPDVACRVVDGGEMKSRRTPEHPGQERQQGG